MIPAPAMPYEPEIRERVRDKIRAKLDAGTLPRDRPPMMFAGYGTRNACDACDETILPAQVEYEISYRDGRAFQLHLGCAGLWDAELRRRGLGE